MPLSRKQRYILLGGVLMACVSVLSLSGYLLWRGQPRSVAAIHRYGGFVHYDYHWTGDRVDYNAASPTSGVLKALLGDSLFHPVTHVSLVFDYQGGQRVECTNLSDAIVGHFRSFRRLKSVGLHGTQATDESMIHLGAIPTLERIYMWDAAVTDAGIERLAGLQHLRYLHVSNSGLTDRSLAVLGRLPGLEGLSLQGNAFTDAGLAHLSGLTNLTSLWLGSAFRGTTAITDAGLAHLSGLERLEELDLQGSQLTDAGLRRLRLPRLKRLLLHRAAHVSEEGVASFRAAHPDVDVSYP